MVNQIVPQRTKTSQKALIKIGIFTNPLPKQKPKKKESETEDEPKVEMENIADMSIGAYKKRVREETSPSLV